MRVLVACEYSGVVRDAFKAKGHDALSCDLLPTERKGEHYQGPVSDVLARARRENGHPIEHEDHFDMMIAHPPCTHLASSGARWWKQKEKEQAEALEFVLYLVGQSHIPRIAIENPIGALSRLWRKPDQIIQPWQYGHGETKATCLWLKGLPLLKPTNIVKGREPRIHRMSPGPNRWKERSRTYQGIADAMADQWGKLA